MIYTNKNGEFPKYAGDIMGSHPSWNIGDSLPEGWNEVEETEPPQLEDGQVIASSGFTEAGGRYVMTWQVRDATAEEIEAQEAPMRAKERLTSLGFSNAEIKAIAKGLVD
jgi:hypothetical protein